MLPEVETLLPTWLSFWLYEGHLESVNWQMVIVYPVPPSLFLLLKLKRDLDSS